MEDVLRAGVGSTHGTGNPCALQKVDPALIAWFRLAMISCFAPIDYNRARLHLPFELGLLTTSVEPPMKPDQHRHPFPDQRAVASRPVLGGLHHDYRLSRVA